MENLTPKLWYSVWLDGDAAKAIVDVRKVAEALPHGSGLDGDWYITVRRSGDIGLVVDYHMMNENGYYCGWRTLRASIVKMRREVRHPLGTPGFVQILHKKGDVILKTASNGEAGDWFHEVLADALDAFVVGTGWGCIHDESGKPAVWSKEAGGWVVA